MSQIVKVKIPYPGILQGGLEASFDILKRFIPAIS
jgi:hypothetical protein